MKTKFYFVVNEWYSNSFLVVSAWLCQSSAKAAEDQRCAEVPAGSIFSQDRRRFVNGSKLAALAPDKEGEQVS